MVPETGGMCVKRLFNNLFFRESRKEKSGRISPVRSVHIIVSDIEEVN